MNVKIKQITVVMIVLLVLVAVGCGADGPAESDLDEMGMEMDAVPGDLDTSTTRMTEDERFHVTISSDLQALTINEIHSWRVHVETPDGQSVNDAQLSIDGGMPQHNHGFPTVPEITQFLGEGDYLLEGVRFNMPGWWEMRFDIDANGQQDSVTFNIVLE
ncbi:MAG: FixH family protein [Candidatus Promineifilaceae bacterium]|nr:FixH family protein [Candidatus Promineifilaceae bacterium]